MGKIDDSLESAQNLIDLINTTQATLDKGKNYLEQGKEAAEYANTIKNWAGSGKMEQEEAERAILNKKKEAFKRRYRILWFLILLITILICFFL